MSAPELDVSAVARLARLALTEEEIATASIHRAQAGGA